jgi:predicted Fe-Mo cluster-binding NifX family protein
LNTFSGHARGLEGAGHEIDRHGLILSALRDCTAIISHGMGQRIYQDLHHAGIEAIITDETDAEQALQLYVDGELEDRPELGCRHDHEQA